MKRAAPSRRAIVAVLALFYVVGLAMIGGGIWSYIDEHSGQEVQAKVIDCYSTGGGKGSSVYCTGRWVVNDHAVTGDIFNGRMSDEGKTLTVRAHGNHASKPTLWISIACAIFGALIVGFGIWLTARVRRPGFFASPASSA